MVRIISKQDLLNSSSLQEELSKSVFIYPTDTIYGIGCDARNDFLVNRIREIKKREQNPFSVIVPSKDFIFDNCSLSSQATSWLDKLPGPFTLICSLNKLFISKKVIPKTNLLGIRMIDSWFQKIVFLMGFPIVTTSVNFSGEKPMTSLDDLNEEIKSAVDFIIDDGLLSGSPSTLVFLSENPVRVIRR